MIPRSHKLNLRQQDSFFKTAQRYSTQSFTVLWKQTGEQLLFQVIVARGIAQNAVERNALKRAVYDICAQFLPNNKNAKTSIVVIIRNKQITEWQQQLLIELERILKQ